MAISFAANPAGASTGRDSRVRMEASKPREVSSSPRQPLHVARWRRTASDGSPSPARAGIISRTSAHLIVAPTYTRRPFRSLLIRLFIVLAGYELLQLLTAPVDADLCCGLRDLQLLRDLVHRHPVYIAEHDRRPVMLGQRLQCHLDRLQLYPCLLYTSDAADDLL